MSAREPKTKRSAATKGSQPEQYAFYVYCVGETHALAPLFEAGLPADIEGEARLEMEADGPLAAVVSAVPLADYGEDALQARLTDATWTAVRAMRHEKVVEHFASRASVVPLRFGTIYLERASVRQMLSQRAQTLSAIIERLRGREEWGVNVLCDRQKLLETITSLSPRLRELSEQAANASPGQAYLLRKKVDAMRVDEARREMKQVASKIESELAPLADGTARLRVLKDEGGENDPVARLAMLVARDRFEDFRAAAERLAQAYAPAGFQLELTGPWPAYNFAATI
ncbi:MAG: GvpL/GvpF family gas vesicle protein [Pyrinomonadaceae bacterium]